MFPMNFVVGAVVGAATTYIYKDDNARQKVSGVKEKISGMFSKKKPAEEASEATDGVVAAVADPVVAHPVDGTEAVPA